MAKQRRGRRTLTTLVVLVLVSVSIITLVQRGGAASRVTSAAKTVAHDLFTPLRDAVDAVVHPIGNFFAGTVNYGSVLQENNQLRHTIGQLRMQQLQQAYLREQLRQVLALQHLPFVGSLPTVMAQTEEVNVSNFAATITIDKGRSDGVAVGMPVVGSGGLVGQVVTTLSHQATVRLVTDGQFRVGVQFGDPPNLASLSGQGPGDPMTADFVVPGTPIRPGELMLTNGLAGGEYPAGIPVATVQSASTPPGAGQMAVTAKPTADLRHLAYVDVVQWLPTP